MTSPDEHGPATVGNTRGQARSKRRLRRRVVWVAALSAVTVLVGTGVTAAVLANTPTKPAVVARVAAVRTPPSWAPAPLPAAQLVGLPAAVYNAVIPGLLAYTDTHSSGITSAYTAAADVPVYGVDHTQPVAKLPAKNFLGLPTVIVPVRIAGPWALVLTPARQTLPSATSGLAAAQTAGWVPTQALTNPTPLPTTITVSVSKQTLTLTTKGRTPLTFPVGVGTAKTPTPTGTIGYLQARYEDPTQARYPIQLTSLHSPTADNPYGGEDGGLIGIHYNTTNTGAVSHGCIRLTYAALAAINQLPLGTPIILIV